MKRIFILISFLTAIYVEVVAEKPWQHGKLKISENRRFVQHEDGTLFFWLGNTAWLMPERLNRDEVDFYLDSEKRAGFNVEQVQVINSIPTFNIYGHPACNADFDFGFVDDSTGVYGYWQHMDYIVEAAARNGIYIAMDCIWGSQISRLDTAKAARLGTFLGRRYKNAPNIIWMIGGDIRGDKKPEVWTSLAEAIRREDPNHLVTFHPRGRTTSAFWFAEADWLDFHMFQSGHRRYGQRNGDGDYMIADDTEEDNWRYVELQNQGQFQRPILDAEPSYEAIPQGLHDLAAPRWTAKDVRRYAYWSVFAGAFGHTYGHNSIMQFYRPGLSPAYGADTSWIDALEADGRNQMQHLKRLILLFADTERVNDQSVILSPNGEKYERLICLRGRDYVLIYNYIGKKFQIDPTCIDGDKKCAYWFNPSTGEMTRIGYVENRPQWFSYKYKGTDSDRVLVVVDAAKWQF